MFKYFAITACTFALLSACDDPPDEGNDMVATSCQETATVLASTAQVSDLVGVSADDLLAESGVERSFTASYNPSEEILSQSPSSGETELTIVVTYTGGEIREIESLLVQGADEIALECTHRVEMEVEVFVSSVDGSFEETWDAVLAGSGELDGDTPPRLSAAFDPYDLEGGYEIESLPAPDPDSVDGFFYTEMRNETFTGELSGEISVLIEESGGEGDDAWVSQAQHVALGWGETWW